MAERGVQLLQVEGSTRPGAKIKLLCAPPREISKEWVRDGIPARVPHGRGKLGFCVERVCGFIPLPFWNERLGVDPSSLLAAAQENEFGLELITGWTRAATLLMSPSPLYFAWVEVLWKYWLTGVLKCRTPQNLAGVEVLLGLLRGLPADRAEALVQPCLDAEGKWPPWLVVQLLRDLPRPWSPTFAEAFLTRAREVVKYMVIDQAHEWTKSLAAAALAVPHSCFDSALRAWDTNRLGESSWTVSAMARQVEGFVEAIGLRKSFHDALARELAS
jgi:hypothetical protein